MTRPPRFRSRSDARDSRLPNDRRLAISSAARVRSPARALSGGPLHAGPVADPTTPSWVEHWLQAPAMTGSWFGTRNALTAHVVALFTMGLVLEFPRWW